MNFRKLSGDLMNKDEVEAIFQRMHKACGVSNDYQLSKYLDVQPSSVKGWKIAKHPPYKACYEIFERTGHTVEWLVSGKHPVDKPGLKTVKSKTKPRRFNMTLEEFTATFHEAIKDGLRMKWIELGKSTSKREIDELAALYYGKVNDEIEIPDLCFDTQNERKFNQS